MIISENFVADTVNLLARNERFMKKRFMIVIYALLLVILETLDSVGV